MYDNEEGKNMSNKIAAHAAHKKNNMAAKALALSAENQLKN